MEWSGGKESGVAKSGVELKGRKLEKGVVQWSGAKAGGVDWGVISGAE